MNLSKLKSSTIVLMFFAITFFVCGLLINLVQLIAYLTIRNYSTTLYRKVNYYLTYIFMIALTFIFEWWSASDISFYINKNDFEKYLGKEHAFIITNHRYDIDWLVGLTIANQYNVLGNCKSFMKKATQYLPIAGWTFKFSESIFVERSFDKDKEIISKQIRELGNYPDPIWLSIFPEGTRFTLEKHEISKKFAEKNGLPTFEHHLTPRTKGFTTSMVNMRGKINAIYDGIVVFDPNDNEVPTMKNLLSGKKVHAHMYLERIPIDNIPETEEEAAKWLYDRYLTKDKLYESFMKTGDFFNESGVKRIPSFKLPVRVNSLILAVVAVPAVISSITYYLFNLIINGNLLQLGVIIAILVLSYLIVNSIIGATEINKSSSYGTNNKIKSPT